MFETIAVENVSVGDVIRVPGDTLPVIVTEVAQFVDGYTVYYRDTDGKVSFLPVDLGVKFELTNWSQSDFDSFVAWF